ncbi:hypothetical protein PT974_10004 [Cladobotryum mycophilum]|uniref:Cell division protein ZapA n=1 Tax=Cladobotryum mycophilum TaxID=491253 RepID=A0ABR0SA36_9HYPO
MAEANDNRVQEPRDVDVRADCQTIHIQVNGNRYKVTKRTAPRQIENTLHQAIAECSAADTVKMNDLTSALHALQASINKKTNDVVDTVLVQAESDVITVTRRQMTMAE